MHTLLTSCYDDFVLLEKGLSMFVEEGNEDNVSYSSSDDFHPPIGEKRVAPNAEKITRIYCCATMWHETPDEMAEFLKSIFRLDEDYAARKTAAKLLEEVPSKEDVDYYELES